MYDPLQIGAQVWARDRGGDALPPGGTVVAVDEFTERVLVITAMPVRSRRTGGPAYTVDTEWLRIEDLNPDATQPADGRMTDRTKIARHLAHVLGCTTGPWTQRDLDLHGWIKALTTPPAPTRYRDQVDDLDARELGVAHPDDPPVGQFPDELGAVVLDDRVPPGVAIVGDVAIIGGGYELDDDEVTVLERAKAAAARNGVDPDLVTVGASGGVLVDLGGLLEQSIEAHRARR